MTHDEIRARVSAFSAAQPLVNTHLDGAREALQRQLDELQLFAASLPGVESVRRESWRVVVVLSPVAVGV